MSVEYHFKRLLTTVWSAVDTWLPIQPLQELIARYADFEVQSVVITGADGRPPSFVVLAAIYGNIETGGRRSFLIGDAGPSAAVRRMVITPSMQIESSEIVIGPTANYPAADCKSLEHFDHLQSICADPLRSNSYYLAYRTDVRYFDGVKLSVLAGQSDSRFYMADGFGTNARFDDIVGCICTSDGKTLFVAQHSAGLRTVDTKTANVRTIGGRPVVFGYVAAIALYRSPTTEPDSVLLLTNKQEICRFDVRLSIVRIIKTDGKIKSPSAVACTANGTVVCVCASTNNLYSVDPSTDRTDLLAGPSADHQYDDFYDSLQPSDETISDFWIDEAEQAVWLAETASFHISGPFSADSARVRRVTLPPHLFWS